MKISVAYTEMQAKLALLLEYSKTLRKTRDRMESDFNRVKDSIPRFSKVLTKHWQTVYHSLTRMPLQ